MKTSNKILVSAFVVALLILISVHLTLYARYKKGEFRLVSNEWQPNLATLSLDNVKYLSVDNIEHISVQLSDSSKLLYDKPNEKDEERLSFTKKDDTLFVTGRSEEGNIRWYRKTDLYLSQNLSSKFTNSHIHLRQKKTAAYDRVLSFDLDNSILDIDALGGSSSRSSALQISARNKSRISFGDVHVNRLQMQLNDSYVEEEKLFVDSILITTDSLSRIAFRAQNLTKAKLTDHE